MTGSSSVVALQGIPLEGVISQQLPYIGGRAATFEDFETKESSVVAVAFWSENIFTFGASVKEAVEIQQVIQRQLERQWPLACRTKEQIGLDFTGT